MTRYQKRLWKKSLKLAKVNVKANVATLRNIVKEKLYTEYHDAALELRRYCNTI